MPSNQPTLPPPPPPPSAPPPLPPPPTTPPTPEELGGIIAEGVRTLPGGVKLTATPPDGFPVPQLGESVWRNTSQENRTRWPQKAGPKAWVRTFRAQYEENAQETVATLRYIITRLFNSNYLTQNLVVSTPVADHPLQERCPPPWHFLVSGLPESCILTLTNLAVCSTPEITCFFVPYEQPLPTYICTLENFSYPDSAASNTAVAAVVQKELQWAPEVSQFIHDHLRTPDANAAIVALGSIRVSSLVVAESPTQRKTVWNVYCDSPPELSLDHYFEWSALLRRIRYHSEDYGVGTARVEDKQYICVNCKSLDHPSGLCPYPRIHGWFGPSASSATAAEDINLVTRDGRKDPRSPQKRNTGRKFNGSPNKGQARGRGSTRGRYRA
ncbi:hypothetical protein BDN67DRAFT_893814 [Paxillus ammoniavirescens]|nr:hypothetical protein BDN67DRAFT_893814 [Paxillus ammoniavirescens]